MRQREQWLEAAAAGDFSAIPKPLRFASSAGLAHLIDGYAVAGSLENAARLTGDTIRHRMSHGTWPGSAVDLWVALFFLHRASRHGGTDEEDAENPLFNELCEALRQKLQTLKRDEAASVDRAMNGARLN